MDFPDWELLSDDDPCFDPNQNHDKRIIPQKHNPNSDSKNSLDSDYIICPSPNAPKILLPPDRVDPDLIPLESKTANAVDVLAAKGIGENPNDVKSDQHVAPLPSQVSFETKENKFVDNTVNVNPVNRDAPKFEREMADPNKAEDKNSGFNLWKWSFKGIGAICTFGVTAATICVLVIGTHQKNKHHANQKNILSFYTDDKRIKRVMEHATKWNEAISASVRNGPISRANITYGAYPDGLLTID